MLKIVKGLLWRVKGITVYALVGKSGTGKSFRAKLVSEKYSIDYIIDDGLLIGNKKIIAGKSAKKEKSYLGAIKTALFDDTTHRYEVQKALEKNSFHSILLIGTSDKMVKRIGERLNLPPIKKIIRIEEISSQEEISKAIKTRKNQGKHVIPVPAIEVKRDYSHILSDSIRIIFKKGFGLFKKTSVYEKSVVRPEFNKKGSVSISEPALSQMVLHCIDEYNSGIRVNKVTVRSDMGGYRLFISLKIPYGTQLSGNIHDLQEYILQSIERYTGLIIAEVNLEIDTISSS